MSFLSKQNQTCIKFNKIEYTKGTFERRQTKIFTPFKANGNFRISTAACFPSGVRVAAAELFFSALVQTDRRVAKICLRLSRARVLVLNKYLSLDSGAMIKLQLLKFHHSQSESARRLV
jgi:hypothetical protein